MRIGRSDEAHAVSFVYWAKKRSYRFATPATSVLSHRHELAERQEDPMSPRDSQRADVLAILACGDRGAAGAQAEVSFLD